MGTYGGFSFADIAERALERKHEAGEGGFPALPDPQPCCTPLGQSRRAVYDLAWPDDKQRLGMILQTCHDGWASRPVGRGLDYLLHTGAEASDWLNGRLEVDGVPATMAWLEALLDAKAAEIIGADKVAELKAAAGD